MGDSWGGGALGAMGILVPSRGVAVTTTDDRHRAWVLTGGWWWSGTHPGAWGGIAPWSWWGGVVPLGGCPKGLLRTLHALRAPPHVSCCFHADFPKRVSCCFRADSLRAPSCGCCAVWCVRTIAELPWTGLFCPLSHFICSDEELITLTNKRSQIALKRAEKFLGTIKHALEILWEVCRLVKNGVMLCLLRS